MQKKVYVNETIAKYCVGMLCMFWDDDGGPELISVLTTNSLPSEKSGGKYYINDIGYYKHCRLLTEEEIQQLGKEN